MNKHGPARFAWNFCPICGARLAPAHDGQEERPHCGPCRRFFYRNPVPAACCFVTNQAGELLLVQRSIEPCLGEWSLPGGYVELGESSEEAARRELREETGVVAEHMRLLDARTASHGDYGGVMILGYVVERWTGELCADTDASDARFFPRASRPRLCFGLHRELLAIFDAGET